MEKGKANGSDDFPDYVPHFRGEGSCVALGIYASENEARFEWRDTKAELVALGISIKVGRQWRSHPGKLKAFRLELAHKRARDALTRERRPKPAVMLSVAQAVS